MPFTDPPSASTRYPARSIKTDLEPGLTFSHQSSLLRLKAINSIYLETTVRMEPSDPLDSQWISIHIRDHIEDRDINIRDSLVTPYVC